QLAERSLLPLLGDGASCEGRRQEQHGQELNRQECVEEGGGKSGPLIAGDEALLHDAGQRLAGVQIEPPCVDDKENEEKKPGVQAAQESGTAAASGTDDIEGEDGPGKSVQEPGQQEKQAEADD